MRFSAAMAADALLPGRLARRARPIAARIDDVLLTRDDRGQAGRMSLIAFAIRLASAAIAFVSQVLLARWMGTFEYGIFVLVWTTMIILGAISGLGFHGSVVRFIPEYREQGRFAELRALLLGSRLFVFAASTAIALVGAGLLWMLTGRFEDYYLVPFYLGIVCLPMIAVSDLAQGIARAHSWPLLALLPVYILRPVLILVFMAGALVAGYSATAETAMVATIAATYATTLYQLAMGLRSERKVVPTGERRHEMPTWLAVSLPILLVEGFFFVLTNADVLMVGYFLTPHEVAIYFATVKTLALVHFVYFSVKAGVAQRYAQYTHSGDHERLMVFARETVSWTFWPSLFMGVVVLVLGKPLLMLFGEEFTVGYPLLFPLVAGVVLRAAAGPAESLLSMSGNHNVCALIYGTALATNIALTFMLVPVMGLWGVAFATALAIVVETALLTFTVWRKLGIVMFAFASQPSPRGAV